MSISKLPPHTILLSGDSTRIVADIVAGEAITPGHLIQMYDDGGVNKWKKNASATEQVHKFIALDRPEMNKGIDDAYAAGDLVKAYPLRSGDEWYALIASGQDISNAELLQSAGNGTLKQATATTADANVAHFQSLDNPGAVIVTTRIRVQVI